MKLTRIIVGPVTALLAILTLIACDSGSSGTLPTNLAVPEVEPNDSFGLADILLNGGNQGDATDTDIDYWVFSINAGDKVTITVSTNVEVTVTFYDESLTYLAESDVMGQATILGGLGEAATATGSAYITIETAFWGESGTYTLTMSGSTHPQAQP